VDASTEPGSDHPGDGFGFDGVIKVIGASTEPGSDDPGDEIRDTELDIGDLALQRSRGLTTPETLTPHSEVGSTSESFNGAGA
jgi:hypothetical protein